MGRLLGQVSGLEFIARLAQGVPTGIGGNGLAITSSVVQVGTASEAEPLTVLPAIYECWHREEPSFAYSRLYVELMSTGIVCEHVRVIFCCRIVGWREEEMCILGDIPRNFGQAFAAFQRYRAREATAEVKAAITGAGKASFDVNRLKRARIGRIPDGIVGLKVTCDLGGRRLQRTDVKGQHSHVR